MSIPKLVLASSSKYRVRLLEQIGYKANIICAPELDETPYKAELPKLLSCRLAVEKAQKVHTLFPESVIIGADTVACAGRRILPKALNREDALFCLKHFSGRRHRVYTSVCGLYKNKKIVKTALSIVRFKRLSQQEIELFIDSGDWARKAGGYALQGLASAFITWMSGSYTNITGLPLYETYTILTSLGIYPNLDVYDVQKCQRGIITTNDF